MTPDPSEEVHYCPNCGHKINPQKFNFCTNCGSDLSPLLGGASSDSNKPADVEDSFNDSHQIFSVGERGGEGQSFLSMDLSSDYTTKSTSLYFGISSLLVSLIGFIIQFLLNIVFVNFFPLDPNNPPIYPILMYFTGMFALYELGLSLGIIGKVFASKEKRQKTINKRHRMGYILASLGLIFNAVGGILMLPFHTISLIGETLIFIVGYYYMARSGGDNMEKLDYSVLLIVGGASLTLITIIDPILDYYLVLDEVWILFTLLKIIFIGVFLIIIGAKNLDTFDNPFLLISGIILTIHHLILFLIMILMEVLDIVILFNSILGITLNIIYVVLLLVGYGFGIAHAILAKDDKLTLSFIILLFINIFSMFYLIILYFFDIYLLYIF